MDKIRQGSNRGFGIVFFLVFSILSFYPLLHQDSINIFFIIVAIIFLFLGILNSNILYPLNFVWFKFGLFLGKYISPLIMGLVYFIVVFPTFLILKIFKKNYLNLNYDNTIETYWIISDSKINKNMKNQF